MIDKLNLDGLSEWFLHNATTMRELLFSYHDIFVLKPNELGCTSAIKHEICISDDEPFKEHFRCIAPPSARRGLCITQRYAGCQCHPTQLITMV